MPAVCRLSGKIESSHFTLEKISSSLISVIGSNSKKSSPQEKKVKQKIDMIKAFAFIWVPYSLLQ